MTNHVAVVLLAAGKSSRMGCCKQLLPLDDSTVIVSCLNALVAGGAGEIVVVVSEEGHEVAEAVRNLPVGIVVNPEPEGDMASSVRAGRDALQTGASGVIVLPSDYPLVSAATISGLISKHGDSPGSIVVPRHHERRGHPLLFPRMILNELVYDMTLRDLVQLVPNRVCYLDVDDPGVLIDMDTPEDYRYICKMMHANKGLHKKYAR